MSDHLRIKCVIEGVEIRAQLDSIGNLGAAVGQGCYCASPMSRQDFLAFIADFTQAEAPPP